MKKNLYLLLCTALLIASCKETPVTPSVTPKEFAFDTDQNSSLMFQDGESQEVMTSAARRYNIAKLIRVTAVDEQHIEVANFAPIDVENATILATITSSPAGSTPQVVKLFTITKIRAHAKQTIKYPFVDGTKLFLDTNNKEVDLSGYKEGIAPAIISFDFTGDNATIISLKKLAKLKWDIKYHDFDPNNDPNNNWAADITAKDIRRFSGLMINMGIVFVSDAFKTEFLKERLLANDGTTVLTDVQKLKTYNDILNHPYFECGKVEKVSGLGGGSTLGYAEHVIRDYISIDASYITAHEVGHCVGYGHSSNMTYPVTFNNVSTGFSPLTGRIIQKFFNEKLFPVTLDNYYKPADFR